MLSGHYQDALVGEDGRREHATAWVQNTVVYSCWPVVAGLLKGDPLLHGIQFLAVGEGRAAWDAGARQPNAATTRLEQEVARVAIDPAQSRYLDINDQPTDLPTNRLEIQFGIAVTVPRALREFGLFGGNATAAANSGFLINYVTHRRIDLRPGKTLLRRMRLSFRHGSGVGAASSPMFRSHWLAAASVTVVDGVGEALAAALEKNGVTTVGQLADADPTQAVGGLTPTKAAELRAKARLAVQMAAQIEPVAVLEGVTVDELLKGSGLFAPTVPADVLDRIQEQLGFLQVALDSRTLQRMTLKELREGR